MKWFILVLFFNQPDFYVFTEPTFDSEDVCVGSITDPQHYPILVEKLLQEYTQPRKIQSVLCISEEELKDLLTAISSQSV